MDKICDEKNASGVLHVSTNVLYHVYISNKIP